MTRPQPPAVAVRLVLPWPPTLNNYRQPVRVGLSTRLVTSTNGKRYTASAIAAIYEQGKPSIAGPVHLTERFYPRTDRAYDMDNFRKASRDALVKAGVIEDDSLIVRDEGIKMPKDKDNPRVEIEIRAAKECA